MKAILKCYKNVKGLYNLYSEVEGSVFFRNTDDTTRCHGPERNNRYRHLRKYSNFTF